MPPTCRAVTHELELGDRSHRCAWCNRIVTWQYESLVNAAGDMLIACLCSRCVGAAMGAYDKRPASKPVTEQEPT